MGTRQRLPCSISSLRKVIRRALTEKQILILGEVGQNNGETITALVNRISKATQMPLSTLKLNARILVQLGLLTKTPFGSVQLTEGGRLVLSILGGDEP